MWRGGGAEGIEVWMNGCRELGRWVRVWRGNMEGGWVLGEAEAWDCCREERPMWWMHGRGS